MSDTQNKEELNKAICSLYRTFFAVQATAFDYISKGADDDAKKIRAQEVTSALLQGMSGVKLVMSLSGDDKCWDPATQTYVDC
jgi:hypothetical protein